MPTTWTTHLRQFLDETGHVPEGLPAPVLAMVNAMCSYVSYATHFSGSMDKEIPPCFMTTDANVCQGKVFPCLTRDEKIAWRCDTCGSNGVISGWENTIWDLSDKCDLQ